MHITPNVLANLVEGTIDGDGDIIITGFAKIEEAKPGDVSFIANPKYEHFISETKASTLLVRADFPPRKEGEPTLIRVADPYAALADLLTAFKGNTELPVGIEQPCFIAPDVKVPEDAYIGAFAYIGSGVKLEKGVKIFPQCYVGQDTVIGENSILRAGVRVYEECCIGKRCIIHSGAVIGADGFGFAPRSEGYEKIPQTGNVVLEDDVEIGANTTVDRATFGSTVIGEGTKLDNLIQVAHNVVFGKNNVVAAQAGFAGSSKIGDWNQFGGQTGISGHIVIGSFNQIGAQSGIPSSVGDHQRLMGYPAVDSRQFAKNAVYIKNLGKVYEKLKEK